MTKILSFLLIFALAPFAHANRESGGLPPHPSLTTMSVQDAVPGIDFPTDSPTNIQSIVVLLNTDMTEIHVRIAGEKPVLEKAKAGIDYPTDSTPPIWSGYQKVLVFANGDRLPMRLIIDQGVLKLALSSGSVEISKISMISKAEEGIDFPTDGPPNLKRDFHILILSDDSHIVL
jgi:hypothetical protein